MNTLVQAAIFLGIGTAAVSSDSLALSYTDITAGPIPPGTGLHQLVITRETVSCVNDFPFVKTTAYRSPDGRVDSVIETYGVAPGAPGYNKLTSHFKDDGAFVYNVQDEDNISGATYNLTPELPFANSVVTPGTTYRSFTDWDFLWCPGPYSPGNPACSAGVIDFYAYATVLGVQGGTNFMWHTERYESGSTLSLRQYIYNVDTMRPTGYFDYTWGPNGQWVEICPKNVVAKNPCNC